MKVAFFDTHRFEKNIFENVNHSLGHEIAFFEPRLREETAPLACGFPVVCCFVNDRLSEPVLKELFRGGTRLVALRCAGFNHVDLLAAETLGIQTVRVPAYSPHAVAEHALTLVLALNRKIHRAYLRVREFNFSLDGLVGFDLAGKVVGVLGTGKIGTVFAHIMAGMGCEVLAFDQTPNPELINECGVKYVDLAEIYRKSRVISLHLPLTPQTHHIINDHAIAQMQEGVMLINTGRGALIDTTALIRGLKSARIGSAGLDVYEEEENLFFRDLSESVLQDDQLARLMTFPNVLITAHQAFLTEEALANIAITTLNNISDFERNRPLVNRVYPEKHSP